MTFTVPPSRRNARSCFPRWKELGRYVRKGEKAITLCQPVTVKYTTQTDNGSDEIELWTRFTYRPRWFVLAQTDGTELPPIATHAWDAERALAVLDVTEVPLSNIARREPLVFT
jgi:hypothetical protein